MDPHARLRAGLVIPAHPLALTSRRTLDERRQRALTRYYIDAGAGGLAIGVHTTQFAIREHGLHRPVLELAMETMVASAARRPGARPVMIAGAIGATKQALAEAEAARALGYDAVLLSLGALRDASDDELIAHCRAVADVLPLVGFYLQPAVGGRVLSYGFWRAFAEIERVWAVKIAPFDRYRTLEAVRGLSDGGRRDIALYTGNDDSIVLDLVTSVPTSAGPRWFDGGLLGQWATGTSRAVNLLERIRRGRESGTSARLLSEGAALTDFNAAIFDAAHGFAGCIPGIHEILRRQRLLDGIWCLDEHETLSPGQREEIDRVCAAYPFLLDDAFIEANRDRWLS
ncbi:MAG: dihydrodipicolinate synthase family protein [Gemmatimonadaceae bacterium]|nr:dihydrodipicolinate synthase family protein [Gemmatimonadaceae bacterium]NUQ94660.1 dihydrodipicolinate synthase family protein [Gemmatimonadaceae bacterium]NUR18894.1 dihydrodipicolinate synthase family protein [Gemmatimonadaceae bacterium]NUS96620.1 dihydrodipicolinate synthase family protein [Gemmatimonadaceae bacterium]